MNVSLYSLEIKENNEGSLSIYRVGSGTTSFLCRIENSDILLSKLSFSISESLQNKPALSKTPFLSARRLLWRSQEDCKIFSHSDPNYSKLELDLCKTKRNDYFLFLTCKQFTPYKEESVGLDIDKTLKVINLANKAPHPTSDIGSAKLTFHNTHT